MNVERFIYSINNIKDEYIIEYSEIAKKTDSIYSWKNWIKFVACFIVTISFIAILIFPLQKSEIDDPKGGIDYTFNSYSELCEILPQKDILNHIPSKENANIQCSGIHSNKTNAFNKYEEYYYLFLNVNYDNGEFANINCTLNSEKTAKEYVKSKPLTYPPNTTNVATIYDIEIFYNSNIEHNICIAAFYFDDNLYEIQYSTKNTDELIQYIHNILS